MTAALASAPLGRVDLALPLAARRRCAALFGAWTALFLASPGVLFADGSAALGLFGAFAWALTAVRPVGASRRPERAAFVAEWLAACYGFAAQMVWIWYVIPFGFLYPGLGQGLYAAFSGLLARRVARRHGPVAGAFAGWIALEFLRTLVDTPFGFGWQRVAHCGIDSFARILPWFGIEGVVVVVAAVAAAGVAWVARSGQTKLGTAFGVLAVAGLAAGRFAPLPEASRSGENTVDVLCVQPGFSQERKQRSDPRDNFVASRDRTLLALREAPADLVVWGESMLYVPLVSRAASKAIRAGVRSPPWGNWFEPGSDAEKLLRRVESSEDAWVRQDLLARFPAGTAFVAGAEAFDVVEGEICRRNAIALWQANGEREPLAGKRTLVPFAETLYGFERFGWARDAIEALAGFVPDFQSAEKTGVLALQLHGALVNIGASVCFDNAFERPYAGRDLDLHLVVSNEAWYRNAFEMDQMVAFTRALALMTGRPFVRATNSGVTLAVDAGGRETARLRVEGEDRGVAGVLRATVRLPSDRSRTTPYEGLRGPLRIGLLLLLFGLSLSRSRPRPAPTEIRPDSER